ncbi:MAG: hypothetical protein V1861_06940 [Candidatus Micrarchaeota archaeon]
MSYEPPCLPSQPATISYSKFKKRISELKKRWIALFEEIKDKPVSSNDFERIELQLNCELSEVSLILLMRKMCKGSKTAILENDLNTAKNEIMSYKEKARTLSSFKSRSKNQKVLGQVLELLTEAIKKIPNQVPK